MKIINKVYFLCILSTYFLNCSKSEYNYQENLIICISNSEPCDPTGSIEIKGSVPIHSKFKLNNSNFQSEPLFTKIYPGQYKLAIQQKNNCDTTYNIDIKINKAGALFTQIYEILNIYCSKCHSSFNPQAGIDLTNTCQILNHWKRIKARAIDSNPSPMPPTGLIEKNNILIISEWIRLGHSYHL